MFHRHRTTIVEIAGVSWYCANYCWFAFIVVWSFFNVFLIFCITSFGEKSPQHQETTRISDPVLVRFILQAEPGADLEGGCRGCAPPPPGMTYGRFLINTVQSLHSHTKSALSFDMYSQQFTLCYFLVKSPLLRIRF